MLNSVYSFLVSRLRPALLLRRSPLVHVLAQVRFGPILKLAEYVPDLQERFRRLGYPLYEEASIRQLLPGTSEKSLSRWSFVVKEKTDAVLMSPAFFVLETSHYTRFETFLHALHAALGAFREEVGETVVSRIGLRYVDAIRPDEAEDLGSYVRPGLLGFSESQFEEAGLPLVDVLRAYESRGRTRSGTLIMRVHQSRDGSYLPPDLRMTPLGPVSFDPPLAAGELVTSLDIDHFEELSMDFEPDTIIDQFWRLHDYTETAFRSAVTDHALERWEVES